MYIEKANLTCSAMTLKKCPTKFNPSTNLKQNMYSCNNITTTLIQISRLFYFGFFFKTNHQMMIQLKFGYSEKATKFEKIFHLKFDSTQ